ncbi:hypothetical protein GQ42DRAFT_160433 [Ramicandelaber brevisporus]|nr:hypothetical protein GQ42DRAFT_160433 [Ramicandelaber brevisporus]
MATETSVQRDVLDRLRARARGGGFRTWLFELLFIQDHSKYMRWVDDGTAIHFHDHKAFEKECLTQLNMSFRQFLIRLNNFGFVTRRNPQGVHTRTYWHPSCVLRDPRKYLDIMRRRNGCTLTRQRSNGERLNRQRSNTNRGKEFDSRTGASAGRPLLGMIAALKPILPRPLITGSAAPAPQPPVGASYHPDGSSAARPESLCIIPHSNGAGQNRLTTSNKPQLLDSDSPTSSMVQGLNRPRLPSFKELGKSVSRAVANREMSHDRWMQQHVSRSSSESTALPVAGRMEPTLPSSTTRRPESHSGHRLEQQPHGAEHIHSAQLALSCSL